MTSHFSVRRDNGPYGKLLFDPPCGSQGLKEALRLQYPKLSDYRSRVEKASLEFFLNEIKESTHSYTPAETPRNDPKVPVNSPPTSDASNFTAAANDAIYDSGIGSSRSCLPPSKDRSRRQMSRQRTTLALEMMDQSPSEVFRAPQIVFDSNMQVLKPQKRRRFTPEEKANIMAVRKAGACTHCRKRKRKCTHIPGPHIISRTEPIPDLVDEEDQPQTQGSAKPPLQSHYPGSHSKSSNYALYPSQDVEVSANAHCAYSYHQKLDSKGHSMYSSSEEKSYGPTLYMANVSSCEAAPQGHVFEPLQPLPHLSFQEKPRKSCQKEHSSVPLAFSKDGRLSGSSAYDSENRWVLPLSENNFAQSTALLPSIDEQLALDQAHQNRVLRDEPETRYDYRGRISEMSSVIDKESSHIPQADVVNDHYSLSYQLPTGAPEVSLTDSKDGWLEEFFQWPAQEAFESNWKQGEERPKDSVRVLPRPNCSHTIGSLWGISDNVPWDSNPHDGIEMEPAGLMDHYPAIIIRGIVADPPRGNEASPRREQPGREQLTLPPAKAQNNLMPLMIRFSHAWTSEVHSILYDATARMQEAPGRTSCGGKNQKAAECLHKKCIDCVNKNIRSSPVRSHGPRPLQCQEDIRMRAWNIKPLLAINVWGPEESRLGNQSFLRNFKGFAANTN
ncbi:MAG: hypothetical protein M1836_002844 [Candelina mexicana]|nr:MAG: hypothetical protein M1836_002844 [Candelina mexicana]